MKVEVIAAYVITHKETGKMYVGSSKNVNYRLRKHRSLLRRGIHPCKELQKLYTDDGCIYSVVYETTTRDDAFNLEQALVDDSVSTGLLLNRGVADVRNPGTGVTYTAEERKRQGAPKIKEVCDGYKPPPKHPHIPGVRKGRPLSEEQRQRRRDRGKNYGRPVSIKGVIYPSMQEAARQIDIGPATLRYRTKDTSDTWADCFYV